MDSTIHSIVTAQYIQDRVAHATSARAAREPRRSWTARFRRDGRPAATPLTQRPSLSQSPKSPQAPVAR
jgi:hypothetical protein